MRGIKNRESGKWKRPVFFGILLLVFALLINSTGKVYQKKKEAEKILVQMNEEMTKLEKRDQFLAGSLDRIATKEGLEFEIRKKLNVAASGESVAVIVDENQSTTTSSKNISPWQKFKNFFTNLFD